MGDHRQAVVIAASTASHAPFENDAVSRFIPPLGSARPVPGFRTSAPPLRRLPGRTDNAVKNYWRGAGAWTFELFWWERRVSEAPFRAVV